MDDDVKKLVKGLVKKCGQDNRSEDETVAVVGVFLLTIGFTNTPEGAILSHDALHELVSYYRSTV